MKRFFSGLTLALLLSPIMVSAVGWADPFNGQSLQSATGGIIRALVGYVGIAGLLGFLWGGFTWMSAGGDMKKVGQAKQIMVWTTVGMAIVFLSYAIVSFVITTLIGVTATSS